MQVKIGNKIKELRKRDGRKQEDLANALGVTCQAVSRWEANGGYPDMEIIPAIANYFNVSIDELFGYSRDREEKLKNILEKAEDSLNRQKDMTECVKMLRAAAEEFPSEAQILVKLGYALNIHGWKQYGARSYTTDGSDYAYEDTEYNAGNVYWQEEIRVFEKALTMDIPAKDREVIISMLVTVYAKMGYTDKAITLAQKQNSISMSRELLLPKATAAEEQDAYQGKAIIALLSELKKVIWHSVCTKISMFTTPQGTKTLLDLAALYESVFSDGRCGQAHKDIRDLYMTACSLASRQGADIEESLTYFHKAFIHHKALEALWDEAEYSYTSPLVAKVRLPREELPSGGSSYFKKEMEYITEELHARIKADPRYEECFAN